MKVWKYAFNVALNHKKSKLTEQELEKDLEEIITYLLSQKNYPLYQNAIEKINKYYQLHSLTLEDKMKMVEQLMNLFNCDKINCNLNPINDSKLGDRIGRLSGCNITGGVIYNTSVTGIREITDEL